MALILNRLYLPGKSTRTSFILVMSLHDNC